MADFFTNINTIVTIIGILVGLPAILVVSKKMIPTNRVDCNSIRKLEDNGLIIENSDILSEIKTIHKFRYLYFPVLPTPKPNIIHLLFCNYVNLLTKYGIRVNVFVFDEYYRLIGSKADNVAKSDVDNFIEVISKHFTNKKNINVIRESSLIKIKGEKILKELLKVSSSQTLGDIRYIQKEKYYIKDKVSFSRFMKPLFNMLYLRQTSTKYGFTLSGMDEKELWKLFDNTRDAKQYKLCNLYIPKIEGLEKKDTDVLDTKYNISFGEKEDDILDKVESYFSNLKNLNSSTCIALFIKIILFSNENEIRYKTQDNNHISISSWDSLINKLSSISNEEKNNLQISVAKLIYQKINLKE